MAKFKFKPTVSVDSYFTAKIADAIDDDDVGKAVKLDASTTDVYTLCSDGDHIDAFIVGMESATADGKVLATLQGGERKRVEASGAMNVGDLVESGAVAAAGTAETNGLPLVSTKAAVSADLANDASGTEIATAVNALLADALVDKVQWRVISADTTDGSITDGDQTVVIERV